MTYKIIISKEALQDEIEAYFYYENILEGLGDRFLASLEKSYEASGSHPEYYSFSDKKKIIRDISIDGFPFLVIYEIIGNIVVIFSVHNCYKKPFLEE